MTRTSGRRVGGIAGLLGAAAFFGSAVPASSTAQDDAYLPFRVKCAQAQGLTPPAPMVPPTGPVSAPPPLTLQAPSGTGAPSLGVGPVSNAYDSPAARAYDAEQVLARSEDSGRGLEFFYAHAGIGFSALGLQTISSRNLGIEQSATTGGVLDIALGVRLLFLTFGPRLRYHFLSGFDLLQVNAELGLHIPVGSWDPFFSLQAGYASAGNVSQQALASTAPPVAGDVQLSGGAFGVHGGTDYYFSPFASLGGELGLEMLFLGRPAITTTDPILSSSGRGTGLSLTAGVHLALHF